MKAKCISAAKRYSASSAAFAIFACDLIVEDVRVSIFADVACGVEMRLLSPAQQLGTEMAWVRDDNNSRLLIDRSAAVPLRFQEERGTNGRFSG